MKKKNILRIIIMLYYINEIIKLMKKINTDLPFYTFGNLISRTGENTSSIGFHSKYYDKESGFYYFYHRYYNPGIGRFTTEDPIGIEGGLNLYGFVNNNPINYIDPWGEIEVFNNISWGIDKGMYNNNFSVTQDIRNYMESSTIPYIAKYTVDMTGYDIFYLTFGWLSDIDSPDKCRRECVRGCLKAFGKNQMSGIIKQKSITKGIQYLSQKGYKLGIVHEAFEIYFVSQSLKDFYEIGKCLRYCGRK